jgi:hypothetical protein
MRRNLLWKRRGATGRRKYSIGPFALGGLNKKTAGLTDGPFVDSLG